MTTKIFCTNYLEWKLMQTKINQITVYRYFAGRLSIYIMQEPRCHERTQLLKSFNLADCQIFPYFYAINSAPAMNILLKHCE